VLERVRLECSFNDTVQCLRNVKDSKGYLSPFQTVRAHIFLPDGHVMNEIALHRGGSAHLNTIDVFVDGQHLTEGVVCAHCLHLFTRI
jgi:NAD kinase